MTAQPYKFARQLRRSQTDAERLLWRKIRNRQLADHKFRRQHPLGHFIADFVCVEKKLIVELDGGQHQVNVESDARRSAELEKLGYRVIRFWNHEVLTNTNGVLEDILANLTTPHPNPLPAPRGEGNKVKT